MTGEGMTGISGRARRSRDGMTLIEAMIAMVVIAVALLAMLSLIMSAGVVQDDSRERTLAYNAARQIIEDMRAKQYASQVYDAYKSGGSVGCNFRVDDLPTGPNDLDHPVMKSATDPTLPPINAQGRILFPEDTPGGGLTEAPTDGRLRKEFNMPKDLNHDGDDSDSGASLPEVYILPVKVEVQWTRPGGKVSRIEVITLITER